jgi:hypothetical protein
MIDEFLLVECGALAPQLVARPAGQFSASHEGTDTLGQLSKFMTKYILSSWF